MQKEDLIYIAGLFDGEGSISLFWQKRPDVARVRTVRASISIGNTDRSIIEYLHQCLGGNFHSVKRSNPNWKPVYLWTASTNQAVEIIKELLPYLRIKKKQAELLIEYQQYKRSIPWRGRTGYTESEWNNLWTYCKKMRELNACSGNKVNHSVINPRE